MPEPDATNQNTMAQGIRLSQVSATFRCEALILPPLLGWQLRLHCSRKWGDCHVICQVNEIYPCLMGESIAVGLPAVLLRLSGCNLACQYCDTLHSRTEPGNPMTAEEVVDKVATFGLPRVLITGGEPMLQPEATRLLAARFLSQDRVVYLETNGSLPLDDVPPGVIKVVDVKSPGSGHGDSFLRANLKALGPSRRVEIRLGLQGGLSVGRGIPWPECPSSHCPRTRAVFALFPRPRSGAVGRVDPGRPIERPVPRPDAQVRPGARPVAFDGVLRI